MLCVAFKLRTNVVLWNIYDGNIFFLQYPTSAVLSAYEYCVYVWQFKIVQFISVRRFWIDVDEMFVHLYFFTGTEELSTEWSHIG
jgi:hypothetical protein